MSVARFSILLIFILSSSPGVLLAQKQSNIWYFGHHAGLSFNSGVPVPLTDGALSSDEGCSTIADVSGNLLFYTDGIKIWNRNHTLMPNGSGLTGDNSSTQSALIVQKPGSTNLYYVFTTFTTLNYSIVDMNLNGGMGDVISGSKNILLISNAGEKICGTPHQNGNDIWVMSHEYTTNGFNAFLLTSNGISTTPVHSNSGLVNSQNGAYGQMKFTCKGDRIAYGIADQSSGTNMTICVSDFNNSTGVVSNSYSLKTDLFQTYGIEFSPNGKYLYGAINWALTQYNLDAGSPAAVQASVDSVGTSTNFPFDGLQLGPDGKLYAAMGGGSFLSVINKPDLGGAACNFVPNAVSLGGKTVGLDMPSIINFQCSQNTVPLVANITQVNIHCHDSCNGSATVHITQGTPPYHILWSPGNDTTLTIKNLCDGSYVLKVTDGSGTTFTDSLKLTNPAPLSLSIQAGITSICANDSVKVSATSGFASYNWNMIGSDSIIQAKVSGNYYVEVTDATGCRAESNHLIISVYSPPAVIIVASNTQFCHYDSVELCAPDSFAIYQWNTGSNGFCTEAKQAGNYDVTITDNHGCKAQSNVISLSVFPIQPVTVSADTNTFCPSDSVQICATAGFVKYQWNAGGNQTCIQAKQAGNYYVTVSDANNCTAESNHLAMAVHPVPSVSIIVQGDTLSSYNAISYQWYLNNIIISGATSPVYTAPQSGEYSLQIVDTNGCAAHSNNVHVVINGIHGLEKNNVVVNIYPDPFADEIYTKLWNIDIKVNGIEIYDVSGRIVWAEELVKISDREYRLDVAGLSRGIYFIIVRASEGEYAQKLVKL